jgi:hypothetical protein
VTNVNAQGLDQAYALLEAAWCVRSRPELGALVVPNGNGGAPVHRWFRMKEAYSCDLLRRVLVATGLDSRSSLTICDPFCGSGTTAVSLAALVEEGSIEQASFVGLENNPYLHLVSSTKLRALQAPPTDFSIVAQRIATAVRRREVTPAPHPALSTFSDRRYFSEGALEELLRLRSAVDREQSRGASPLATDLARVCVGSIVEGSSSLRRDGRALRFEPNKPAARPLEAFVLKSQEVEDDLRSAPIPVSGSVARVDARTVRPDDLAVAQESLDLALFSPPYPNNIDYTEVYKLEGWLLGFYDDADDFAEQRRQTLRSHASLDFGEAAGGLSDDLVAAVDRLVAPILSVVPETGRYAGARRRTIKGYAYDMLSALGHLAARMGEGGRLVYVVGNSMHGGRDGASVLIAADVLIGQLATLAGFEVDELAIARFPSRRRSASPYLRESVVFCTRRRNA